jgi:hypothetical protein
MRWFASNAAEEEEGSKEKEEVKDLPLEMGGSTQKVRRE